MATSRIASDTAMPCRRPWSDAITSRTTHGSCMPMSANVNDSSTRSTVDQIGSS